MRRIRIKIRIGKMGHFHIQPTVRPQYSRNLFQQSRQIGHMLEKMVSVNKSDACSGQRPQNLEHIADQIDASVIESIDANGVRVTFTRSTAQFQCSAPALMQTLGGLGFIDESHSETLPSLFSLIEVYASAAMASSSRTHHPTKPSSVM